MASGSDAELGVVDAAFAIGLLGSPSIELMLSFKQQDRVCPVSLFGIIRC